MVVRRVTFENFGLLFAENHCKPPQKYTGSDDEQIILKIGCKKFLKHFEIYVVILGSAMFSHNYFKIHNLMTKRASESRILDSEDVADKISTK